MSQQNETSEEKTLSRVRVVSARYSYAEFTLSDGTVLAVSATPNEVFRVDNSFDPKTGEPVYFINGFTIQAAPKTWHSEEQKNGH